MGIPHYGLVAANRGGGLLHASNPLPGVGVGAIGTGLGGRAPSDTAKVALGVGVAMWG